MKVGCAIGGEGACGWGATRRRPRFRGAPLIRQVYDTVRQVFDDIVIVSSVEAIEGEAVRCLVDEAEGEDITIPSSPLLTTSPYTGVPASHPFWAPGP